MELTCEHAYDGRSLDNVDLDGNGIETLCTVRVCVYCNRTEAKPYGSGSRKGWRVVKS